MAGAHVPSPTANASLTSRLENLLKSVPATGLSVAQLTDSIGREGLLMLSVLLSLPFLLPVSIPGVSTVFGGLIMLIGVAELLGVKPWLPKKIAEFQFTQERISEILRTGSKWVQRLERLSRPRLTGFTNGLWYRFHCLMLILAAGLLLLPLGLVPFSNTLPALACIFLSLALVNKDGLLAVAGIGFLIVSAIYFTAIFMLGTAAVMELFKRFL